MCFSDQTNLKPPKEANAEIEICRRRQNSLLWHWTFRYSWRLAEHACDRSGTEAGDAKWKGCLRKAFGDCYVGLAVWMIWWCLEAGDAYFGCKIGVLFARSKLPDQVGRFVHQQSQGQTKPGPNKANGAKTNNRIGPEAFHYAARRQVYVV